VSGTSACVEAHVPLGSFSLITVSFFYFVAVVWLFSLFVFFFFFFFFRWPMENTGGPLSSAEIPTASFE